ncbi:MAG: hypothetical protein J1E77_03170 [Prevotella sp.]|nr:hypothetical protein [Prevotella sp.]
MKRLFLTTIAVLSMTMAFAENESAKSVNNVETYDMTINMRKLAETLGLTFDQMDAVETIHQTFNAEMLFAAQSDKEQQQELLDKAVSKDVKWMRYVLNDKQYRKYLLLLNTTLNNRGLKVSSK